MQIYKIAPLCRLLGISRWGYYKHDEKEDEESILITSVVLCCNYIRAPDNLPKSGSRELLDLLNTTPKLVARRAGRLVVAYITYVYCSEGFGYLSLLMDAYSRYIVGWCFHETLETDGPLQALKMAIECYAAFGTDISELIHHSDRGVQYTSQQYVEMLLAIDVQISMTQTGDPLHNALAERMDNTMKNSWLFNNGELDFITCGGSIGNSIYMYNTARPHQALDIKTPYEMMTGHADNPLLKYELPQVEKDHNKIIK